MHNFTLKADYRHFIKSEDKWIYTTRIYACDHIAVMDASSETIVSAFTNDGSRVIDVTIPHYGSSSQAGEETCTRVILENAHGRTSQVVTAPKLSDPQGNVSSSN